MVHHDPAKPRCKKWVRCNVCKSVTPKWSSNVDHIIPVTPVSSSFKEMSLDDTVNNLWCEESNLQVICKVCHDMKSEQERKVRHANKKSQKSLK